MHLRGLIGFNVNLLIKRNIQNNVRYLPPVNHCTGDCVLYVCEMPMWRISSRNEDRQRDTTVESQMQYKSNNEKYKISKQNVRNRKCSEVA